MSTEAVMIEENLGRKQSTQRATKVADGLHSEPVTLAEIEAYREVRPVSLSDVKPARHTHAVELAPATDIAQRRHVHLHRPFEETM